MHVVEKLWDAGSSVHKEGSAECKEWVERQKDALYSGKAADVVAELERRLAAIPRTGPGTKYRRKKLTDISAYIAKRQTGMNGSSGRTVGGNARHHSQSGVLAVGKVAS